MATEIENEILLRNGRFYKRVSTLTDLGSQDSLLQQLSEVPNTFLRNVAILNDNPVHILTSKGGCTMITVLKHLPFEAWWTLNAHPSTQLKLHFQDTIGAIKISDPWIPPIGKLIFVVRFTESTYDKNHYVDHCFLYLYLEKELWKLPYPNIFEDGRICMGNTWDGSKNTGQGMLNDFIHAYNTFHSTIMSSHLVKTETHQVFARKADPSWIKHTPDNLKTCLTRQGPAFMQGFLMP